jgi:putative sigma-54 modulation protein
MDIIIQSLGFTTGESLENFIKEKVNTLKSSDIVRATVTLYKSPSGNPESDYCEIRLEVPGNDLFVKKHSEYFETSVNECVYILALQIKKNKEKYVKTRKADANVIQDELISGEEDDEDIELEDVVK